MLSLEGNTLCDKNQKYTTDLTFICNKNVSPKIQITIMFYATITLNNII